MKAGVRRARAAPPRAPNSQRRIGPPCRPAETCAGVLHRVLSGSRDRFVRRSPVRREGSRMGPRLRPALQLPADALFKLTIAERCREPWECRPRASPAFAAVETSGPDLLH